MSIIGKLRVGLDKYWVIFHYWSSNHTCHHFFGEIGEIGLIFFWANAEPMQWTIRFLVVCNMSKNATIFPQSLCTTLVAISRQMDRGNENSSDWAIWYVSSSRMSQSNPQNNVNILALTLRYTSFSEKSSKTDEGYGVRYRVSTNPRTWHQKIYFTEPASFFKPGMNVILIESLIESSTVQIEKAASRDKLLKFHHLLISPMTPPRLLKASWNCGISWCFADVFTPPPISLPGPSAP